MTEYLEVAVRAARRAGKHLLEGMHRPLEVREVTQHDVKLALDVECETMIREVLHRAYPDHALLGEEEGGVLSPATPTWIIDPLDGTVNYAHRLPHFCVSIALQMGDTPLVGVVYAPVLDELFTAEAGQGAYCNGAPLQVSATPTLAEAALAMGFAKSMETINLMMGDLNGLAHAVSKIRILGAAALDLSFVAAGRLDGFLEYGLRTWDIAAASLIIQEAGGRVLRTPAGHHAWDVRADNGKLWAATDDAPG